MSYNFWSNTYKIELSEVRIGNVFYNQSLNECRITDIDPDGTIQYFDLWTQGTYANENVSSLRPVSLPDGFNTSTLMSDLKDSGFVFTNDMTAVFDDITLQRDFMTEGWVLRRGIKEIRVQFKHQLQNAYQDLTLQKLIC